MYRQAGESSIAIKHARTSERRGYHLLIETPEANLARGMRQLNGVYTQRFNRVHGRVGHVFQGRYKAILVERDSYLLELARYVVLNPLRAKMVKGRREKRSARRGLGPFRRMLTVENVESSNALLPPLSSSRSNLFFHR